MLRSGFRQGQSFLLENVGGEAGDDFGAGMLGDVAADSGSHRFPNDTFNAAEQFRAEPAEAVPFLACHSFRAFPLT